MDDILDQVGRRVVAVVVEYDVDHCLRVPIEQVWVAVVLDVKAERVGGCCLLCGVHVGLEQG